MICQQLYCVNPITRIHCPALGLRQQFRPLLGRLVMAKKKNATAADKKLENVRIILLNTMISRSTTRAKMYDAPIVPAFDLFKVLEARRKKGIAVEYFGADDHDDDVARMAAGAGHDYVRLCHLRLDNDEAEDYLYVTGLVEYLDSTTQSFPVADFETFQGHEITGNKRDRGVTACHFVVRLPRVDEYQDGKYRCAIEAVHGITRKDIEALLCRQLRRYASEDELSFDEVVRIKGRDVVKSYRYTPRLDLAADVGRKLDTALKGTGELSSMIFTKRHEKETTGAGSAVEHEEFLADIEVRVSASQGPANPEDRLSWAEKIQAKYRQLGYDSKIYFRHVNGGFFSGEVHKAIAGAADLLMCQREHISLAKPPKKWVATIQSEIAEKMRELVDNDALWVKSK